MSSLNITKFRITIIHGIAIAFIISGIDVLAQNKGWSIKAPLETGRGFVSGAILDGKIYLTGGFTQDHSATPSVEVYDPATDSWTRRCDMPEARCAHATCTWREKIYVFGGVSPDAFSDSKDNVYEYDPKRDEWMEKKKMPYSIAFCGIAVVVDTIYLIGGMKNYFSSPVSNVLAYHPDSDTYSMKKEMSTARGWLSACTVQDEIFVIGGTTNYRTSSFDLVEMYSPDSNSWETGSSMPTSRLACSICSVDGKIYIIGGFNQNSMLKENEMYDTAVDQWINRPPIPDIRHTFFAGAIQDNIYVAGGSYPDPENPSRALLPIIVYGYDITSE